MKPTFGVNRSPSSASAFAGLRVPASPSGSPVGMNATVKRSCTRWSFVAVGRRPPGVAPLPSRPGRPPPRATRQASTAHRAHPAHPLSPRTSRARRRALFLPGTTRTRLQPRNWAGEPRRDPTRATATCNLSPPSCAAESRSACEIESASWRRSRATSGGPRTRSAVSERRGSSDDTESRRTGSARLVRRQLGSARHGHKNVNESAATGRRGRWLARTNGNGSFASIVLATLRWTVPTARPRQSPPGQAQASISPNLSATVPPLPPHKRSAVLGTGRCRRRGRKGRCWARPWMPATTGPRHIPTARTHWNYCRGRFGNIGQDWSVCRRSCGWGASVKSAFAAAWRRRGRCGRRRRLGCVGVPSTMAGRTTTRACRTQCSTPPRPAHGHRRPDRQGEVAMLADASTLGPTPATTSQHRRRSVATPRQENIVPT
mmetsp:Transcript_61847/g.134339  ORF Transcript_61847/g.134339 Transcript_61847/m.134339 type:complete len:432 (+) Transcript_61847:817-2112(+)